MSSVISRLIEKLYGKHQARALFLGLDASGRTTTLYKIKLGEVVTTIPTIGFNVETLSHRGMEMTCWDVGGCDKIRPLWRHYFQNTHAILYFIDSSDHERLEETVNELGKLLAEDELRDAFVVVLANKQDLPNALSADHIREYIKSRHLRASQPLVVIPTCATSGDGLTEVLDAIYNHIRNIPPPPTTTTTTSTTTSTSTPTSTTSTPTSTTTPTTPPASSKDEKKNVIAERTEQVLLEWLEREDSSDEVFLAQLGDCTLSVWDHYTHLRIAWLFLTKHGRREGMKLVFSSIKHFISNSPRTQRSRGTTFHETMTYFWTHMVHYAIATTTNPDSSFKTFLLLNPQLANGGIFLHYYSKKLMLHTPAAQTEVALPDIRPLPSMISNVPQSMPATPAIIKPKETETDAEFLESVRELKHKSWGHVQLIRSIFVALVQTTNGNGAAVATDILKKVIGDRFNATQIHFWIHVVMLAVAKSPSADKASFATFSVSNSGKPVVNEPKMIQKHYSDKLLFSQEAEAAFAPPDLKPLPFS